MVWYFHSDKISGFHVDICVHKSVEFFMPYFQSIYINKILNIRQGSFKSVHCLGKLIQITFELSYITTLKNETIVKVFIENNYLKDQRFLKEVANQADQLPSYSIFKNGLWIYLNYPYQVRVHVKDTVREHRYLMCKFSNS